MKKVIILITLTAICCKGYSQYNKYWTFGDSAGIIFEDDGSITPFNTGMAAFESAATISDSLGNLLFYTNGKSIFNRDNEEMVNGYGLDIGQIYLSDYGSSITQGVIILPIPDAPFKFYVFYIAYEFFPIEILGIRYAVVDMTLQEGLGEVVEKNISIYDSLTCEKLQAVRHANGRDWWLLARQKPYTIESINEIKFIRFLITEDGIVGPFYQHYGPDYEWNDENIGFFGEMVFSPQGDKLAYTAGNTLDLYDFNRCTGELSSVQSIFDEDLYMYGCSFSPDGTKIYIGSGEIGDKSLIQYCLNYKG